MKCVFSLIRFVPDPVRGEFINVGAVVGNVETGSWQLRRIKNFTRAQKLDDSKTLKAVWPFIDEIYSQIDKSNEARSSLFPSDYQLDEAWLMSLHRDHRNVVQFSSPSPIAAESVDDALETIWRTFILDKAHSVKTTRGKIVAEASMRKAYRNKLAPIGVIPQENVLLCAGNYTTHFDFAVGNNELVQLVNTWSFELTDQEMLSEQIKAWAWTVGMARGSSGEVFSASGKKYGVPRDIGIWAVFIPPIDDSSGAFSTANNVFSDLNVEAVPLDNVEYVAQRAFELLGA